MHLTFDLPFPFEHYPLSCFRTKIHTHTKEDWTHSTLQNLRSLQSTNCASLIFYYIAEIYCYSLTGQLASACHKERVNLCANGFYITPDIGFDWKLGKGTPFSYFTYGAAFAEVEIDTLTGDFHTIAADIVMDLGNSLNPAIDVGQVLWSYYHHFHN